MRRYVGLLASMLIVLAVIAVVHASPRSRTSSVTTTGRVTNPDDPYRFTTVDWPTELPSIRLVLDGLPRRLGRLERSPVANTQQWFLVNNIPILAAAGPAGRAVVRYADQTEHIGATVIAAPSTDPLGALFAYFVWGGYPDHCGNQRGSTQLRRVLQATNEQDAMAAIAKIPKDAHPWFECNLEQNPDAAEPMPRSQWAYGIGFTAPDAMYFIAAQSPALRTTLVHELVAAGAKVEASGATPPPRPTPTGRLVFDRILESDIVSFDLTTNQVRTVVSEDRIRGEIAVSPNGRHVAYVATGPADFLRIEIVGIDGSGRRALTNPTVGEVPADGDGWPTFSPDGTWVAFTRNTPGAAAIYLVRTDGTGLRRLASVNAAVPIAWSPDGKYIAASMPTTDTSYDSEPRLVVLNAQTGALVETIGDGSAPAWSPDGKWVAFERDDSVLLWDTVRRATKPVTAFDEFAASLDPVSWSPDGKWLLVRDSESGTFAARPDDTEPTPLGYVEEQGPSGRIAWVTGGSAAP